jgi:hypothetical protein
MNNFNGRVKCGRRIRHPAGGGLFRPWTTCAAGAVVSSNRFPVMSSSRGPRRGHRNRERRRGDTPNDGGQGVSATSSPATLAPHAGDWIQQFHPASAPALEPARSATSAVGHAGRVEASRRATSNSTPRAGRYSSPRIPAASALSFGITGFEAVPLQRQRPVGPAGDPRPGGPDRRRGASNRAIRGSAQRHLSVRSHSGSVVITKVETHYLRARLCHVARPSGELRRGGSRTPGKPSWHCSGIIKVKAIRGLPWRKNS